MGAASISVLSLEHWPFPERWVALEDQSADVEKPSLPPTKEGTVGPTSTLDISVRVKSRQEFILQAIGSRNGKR